MISSSKSDNLLTPEWQRLSYRTVNEKVSFKLQHSILLFFILPLSNVDATDR